MSTGNCARSLGIHSALAAPSMKQVEPVIHWVDNIERLTRQGKCLGAAGRVPVGSAGDDGRAGCSYITSIRYFSSSIDHIAGVFVRSE